MPWRFLLSREGEKFGYFGSHAKLESTTLSDDIGHKIDAYVNFDLPKESKSHCIALAINASMNSDLDSLKEKLEVNLKKVLGRNRKEVEIKYYRHPDGKEDRRPDIIVPVVIGVDGKNCNKLFEMFAEIIQLEQQEDKSDEDKRLLQEKIEVAKNNPAQIIFLK